MVVIRPSVCRIWLENRARICDKRRREPRLIRNPALALLELYRLAQNPAARYRIPSASMTNWQTVKILSFPFMNFNIQKRDPVRAPNIRPMIFIPPTSAKIPPAIQ